MNCIEFMAYLFENNVKARMFLTRFITGFDGLKKVNLEYRDTEVVKTSNNGEVFEVPLIMYDLEMISDKDKVKAYLMISNSIFVHGYDLFIGTNNPHVKAIEPIAFVATITDHFTDDTHHSVIRNSYGKDGNSQFNDVTLYVNDIQLDYLNDQVMEENDASLIYSFLYLLKYNKPYQQGNDIIDSIVETYNKYLKEYR